MEDMIFPIFRPSPRGGGHYQFWVSRFRLLSSTGTGTVWMPKKYLYILEASNKNKNFKQFIRNDKFVMSPGPHLLVTKLHLMVARIWFSIMHVFMAMIPESLLYRLYMNVQKKSYFLIFLRLFRFFSFYHQTIKRTTFFLSLTLFWLQVSFS